MSLSGDVKQQKADKVVIRTFQYEKYPLREKNLMNHPDVEFTIAVSRHRRLKQDKKTNSDCDSAMMML